MQEEEKPDVISREEVEQNYLPKKIAAIEVVTRLKKKVTGYYVFLAALVVLAVVSITTRKIPPLESGVDAFKWGIVGISALISIGIGYTVFKDRMEINDLKERYEV